MSKFFTGVVEDRMDPLKIGRCKVRVVGVHTHLKTVLPTSDLPWAMPMQPLTSAGVSGVGHTPLGPVEGTWVIVFFNDKDLQFPIMIGSLGGIPQKDGTVEEDDGTLKLTRDGDSGPSDSSAKVDSNGEIVRDGDTTPPAKKQEPTATDQVVSGDTTALGKPGNQYTTVSQRCIDLLHQYEGLAKKIGNNQVQAYPDPGTGAEPWTIGYGTTYLDIDKGIKVSQGDIITIAKAEELFALQLKKTYLPQVTKRIRGVVTQSMIDACVSYTYNAGGGGFGSSPMLSLINQGKYKEAATAFLDSRVTAGGKTLAGLVKRRKAESELFLKDGIPGEGKSVTPPADDSSQTAPVGSTNSDGSTSDGKGGDDQVGFKDPNKKYPKYIAEPDTNRLARHEQIEKTIVFKKEAALIKSVPIAGGATWAQSPAPFNADYPFNHVYESESGHTMEFDDTPNAERVHLYHKAGTYTEIDHNGTRVNRIVGDGYEILERNGFIFVNGTYNLTASGNGNVLFQSGMNLYVGGDAQISVSGSCKLNATGSLDIKGKTVNIESEGAFNLKAGAGLNMESSSSMNLKGGGSLAMQSGGSMNILSGGTMNMDYSRGNFGQGAGSAGSASSANAGPSATKGDDAPEHPKLTVNTRKDRAAAEYETEDDGDSTEFKQNGASNGSIDPNDQTPNQGAEETAAPKNNDKQPAGAKCDEIYGMSSYPNNMKLSTNFTVGDLTKGGTRPIVDTKGVSAKEIACNLKGLCEQILEPIKKAYPSMTITSGYRRPGDVGASSATSQHYTGEAVDIFIQGFSRKKHYEAIQQLQQILPYDQLILEYDGSTTVWIHCSFKYSGARKQHFTMYHHSRKGNIGEFLYLAEG
jgi:GH24 family phage-related lysozyme (muramidase)